MPARPLPPTLEVEVTRRPEVLAPVGDLEALAVALGAGADSVYFGLDEGFNARARARNFSAENLPEVVARIHRAGARAYVTLNTLIFEGELPAMERAIRSVAAAGVDAIIVQDPAVCLLARALCPTLELHASTQMTISSPAGARFAEGLGVTRVVVPRELTVAEIAAFARACPLELEVFIHGALCMSWSGQCLTSEAWGGRSANRGQCAQSCRMPYELYVDGARVPTGDVRYLLSPRDLAGHRAIPALMQIGVHGLKIEGRLKGGPYVATAVSGLRRWVDAVADGKAKETGPQEQLAQDLTQMTMAYSRGFGDGFLAGRDHQTLVDGRFPKSRGHLLGEVLEVRGQRVLVVPVSEDRGNLEAQGALESPLPALGGDPASASGAGRTPVTPRAGMGVVFDAGAPEDRDEPGGSIFSVEQRGAGWRLGFGRPGPDLRRVAVGQRVWITSDPSNARAAEQLGRGEPGGRVPVSLEVVGRLGAPLQVTARSGHARASVRGELPLSRARAGGLDEALLRGKLGAFGGTCFRLESIDLQGLAPGLYTPVSQLKAMRRRLVAELLPQIERGPARAINPAPALERLRGPLLRGVGEEAAPARPRIIPLCRTDEQLDAVIESGARAVELDWMEMVGLSKACARARAAGLHITLATVRVQTPGEEGFDRRIAALEPDAVLLRHWGALMHFAELTARGASDRPAFALHGDFSLNVTNSITARHLLGLGLDTITASHDLDSAQLLALLERAPAERTTVVIHQHIPTFHTEHCVYAANLSQGRDVRSCGRPCDRHRVALRDHLGDEHPVIVDVGCRNTVFNARAQSAASLVPKLVRAGVRRLRVEFVWETGEQAARVLAAYERLLAGQLSPGALLREIGTHEQFGVSLGTMKVLR